MQRSMASGIGFGAISIALPSPRRSIESQVELAANLTGQLAGASGSLDHRDLVHLWPSHVQRLARQQLEADRLADASGGADAANDTGVSGSAAE